MNDLLCFSTAIFNVCQSNDYFPHGINITIRYLLSKSTISNTLAKIRFNSTSSKKDDHLSLHISLKDLRLISPGTLRGPAIWSAKER